MTWPWKAQAVGWFSSSRYRPPHLRHRLVCSSVGVAAGGEPAPGLVALARARTGRRAAAAVRRGGRQPQGGGGGARGELVRGGASGEEAMASCEDDVDEDDE